LAIGGWPTSIRRDAVDLGGRLGQLAQRIDQLVEGFRLEQLAIDDAGRADLDDLVALGRIEAGGFGIEDGEGQLGEQAVVQLVAASVCLKRSKS
jgi:hypothetical protein